jgi:hypothetical protein
MLHCDTSRVNLWDPVVLYAAMFVRCWIVGANSSGSCRPSPSLPPHIGIRYCYCVRTQPRTAGVNCERVEWQLGTVDGCWRSCRPLLLMPGSCVFCVLCPAAAKEVVGRERFGDSGTREFLCDLKVTAQLEMGPRWSKDGRGSGHPGKRPWVAANRRAGRNASKQPPLSPHNSYRAQTAHGSKRPVCLRSKRERVLGSGRLQPATATVNMTL